MVQLACSPFVTVDDVFEATCACDLDQDEHGEMVEEYIGDASDTLYVLSGGRVFGRCTRTVWPMRPYDVCWPMDYGRRGWIEWDGIDSIPLMGPQTSIDEITIDGLLIDPSEYGLLEGFKLFRKNGSWPSTNDITLDDTEDGTFTITYSFGRLPTLLTRRATIELVCQMVKDDSQALTRMRGVVSANVQGVSVQMDDDEVRALGLAEVNRFMDVYGARGMGVLGVYTPELNHGWRLLSVTGSNGS